MGRIGTAFTAFFRVLTDAAFAERVRVLTVGEVAATPAPPATAPIMVAPGRSDALNLLAAFQREGRLIDFLQEPIASYSDAQIGAAVREVHRGAAGVLARAFALRPVLAQPEGSTVEVVGGSDAARIRLTGQLAGQPPYRGMMRHAGWEATRIELPQWNGSEAAARVVTPAEVEIA